MNLAFDLYLGNLFSNSQSHDNYSHQVLLKFSTKVQRYRVVRNRC